MHILILTLEYSLLYNAKKYHGIEKLRDIFSHCVKTESNNTFDYIINEESTDQYIKKYNISLIPKNNLDVSEILEIYNVIDMFREKMINFEKEEYLYLNRLDCLEQTVTATNLKIKSMTEL